MLRELKAILDEHPGTPVRIETVARRLGTDAATVTAMIDHAHRRGLLPQVLVEAPSCVERCRPDRSFACRTCPFTPPPAPRRVRLRRRRSSPATPLEGPEEP